MENTTPINSKQLSRDVRRAASSSFMGAVALQEAVETISPLNSSSPLLSAEDIAALEKSNNNKEHLIALIKVLNAQNTILQTNANQNEVMLKNHIHDQSVNNPDLLGWQNGLRAKDQSKFFETESGKKLKMFYYNLNRELDKYLGAYYNSSHDKAQKLEPNLKQRVVSTLTAAGSAAASALTAGTAKLATNLAIGLSAPLATSFLDDYRKGHCKNVAKAFRDRKDVGEVSTLVAYLFIRCHEEALSKFSRIELIEDTLINSICSRVKHILFEQNEEF